MKKTIKTMAAIIFTAGLTSAAFCAGPKTKNMSTLDESKRKITSVTTTTTTTTTTSVTEEDDEKDWDWYMRNRPDISPKPISVKQVETKPITVKAASTKGSKTADKKENKKGTKTASQTKTKKEPKPVNQAQAKKQPKSSYSPKVTLDPKIKVYPKTNKKGPKPLDGYDLDDLFIDFDGYIEVHTVSGLVLRLSPEEFKLNFSFTN
ncbi:MAG: hypothetical protein K5829_14170 [Treponema sp.]|nr:hypothetical protein [Treponema sp.]